MIFNLITYSIVGTGLSLAAYWMRGTTFYNRATDAYRRGDIAAGDVLFRRAKRWSIGTRS